MRRTIFIALGIMAIIVGLECLVIDSAYFYQAGQTNARSFFNPSTVPSLMTRGWTPKEWFPWAFLSVGTIVVLYSFTLPRRWHRGAAD